jgi:hypothetical protein
MRAKKTTKEQATASKTSSNGRGRRKKQEAQNEAPEPAATAAPEASVEGQQPPEDAVEENPAGEQPTAEEGSDEEEFRGWTESKLRNSLPNTTCAHWLDDWKAPATSCASASPLSCLVLAVRAP